ncbi:MAG: hypothetical protein L0226_13650 [Acidobacteria bacterium]|nr:hypothetical protein [Acidobacteriota bacterium]
MLFTNTSTNSNRSIFIPRDTGSPHDGMMKHISGLGQIARLDFERCAVAGEVIYAVESDSQPVSQQDEEARIGTLAYALKKLGNAEDAAEFTRCLNSICEDGDARCRQSTASYFYNEIAGRGASGVLKEMALLAMQLESLNSAAEVVETDDVDVMGYVIDSEGKHIGCDEPHRESFQLFFDREVESIKRMICGRRKSACFVRDECADWLNDLEASGASVEELDDAFALAEEMDQYDENGAIIVMSSHERTTACGRIDPEYTTEDLPECAQHLAKQLRRDYANGIRLEDIWEDINAQIEFTFPVSRKSEGKGSFYSHANRELQRFTRQVLEAILDECQHDFHMTALRTNQAYRRFHKAIRSATDTRMVGEAMKQAYEARQSGELPLKHFAALKTASILQRERLQSAHLSKTAFRLIKEINAASDARLRYLSWAFYRHNQPNHPIHTVPSQEAVVVWAALKARKEKVPVFRRAGYPIHHPLHDQEKLRSVRFAHEERSISFETLSINNQLQHH